MGFFSKVLRRVKVALVGQELLVLGPMRSGKTVIQRYIRTGDLIVEYRPTVKPKKLAKSKRRVGVVGEGDPENPSEGTIRVARGLDVGGHSQTVADAWKKQIQSADIILYVFNAADVENESGQGEAGPAVGLIDTHCEMIAEWLAERTSGPPKLALIGTHCDLIEGYGPLGDSSRAEFQRSREQNPHLYKPVMKLGGALPNRPPIRFGSLASTEEADDLLGRVLFEDLRL